MQRTFFINGKIWCTDGSFRQAFAVRDGHFDFTGSDSEAKNISAAGDEIIDLQGKLVLPALTDGHLHLVYGSGMRKRLDCRNIKSAGELTAAIKKYREQNPGAEWIIGSNLNMPIVFGNRPHAKGNIADIIFSDLPLFIANYDYHSGICNTKALEIPAIKSNLQNFNSEELPKDSKGDYTGIIREEALDFVFGALPEASIAEKCAAVKDFIRVLHSYGITTVSDITLIPDLEVYKELSKRGELNLRINSYIPFAEFTNYLQHKEHTSEFNRDFFSIKGFKAFYDGALGSATGYFSKSYKGTENYGYMTPEAESGELKRTALQIDAAKMQCIIHAIGDKAVTEVLDIAGEMEKQNGKRDRRLRIEHAQHINPADFDRFGRLNVIVSAQPVHLKYDANLVKTTLDDSLVNATHNYNELINRGVVVNFGTDFPIVEVNPFENIQMAVTRLTESGVFNPVNKIPLHECIKAYTYNNAYSNFNESAAGSIEAGKIADFVIMEDNLFEINENEIGNARVRKTFLAGKEVYSI